VIARAVISLGWTRIGLDGWKQVLAVWKAPPASTNGSAEREIAALPVAVSVLQLNVWRVERAPLNRIAEMGIAALPAAAFVVDRVVVGFDLFI
jgi:hypothetical protein